MPGWRFLTERGNNVHFKKFKKMNFRKTEIEYTSYSKEYNVEIFQRKYRD